MTCEAVFVFFMVAAIVRAGGRLAWILCLDHLWNRHPAVVAWRIKRSIRRGGR